MAWASLLLVVLYSPIGSPDFYAKNVYYSASTDAKGADFKHSSNSLKAPVINTNPAQNKEEGLTIPNQPVEAKRKGNYAVNNENKGYAQNEEYSLPMINNDFDNIQNNNINSTENGFVGSLSSRSSRNSEDQSVFQNKGLISSSTDLSLLVDNDPTRQGTGLNDPLGTTDPGGDPFGPPIPVPEGWGFLLVLAGVYAIVKKYFIK